MQANQKYKRLDIGQKSIYNHFYLISLYFACELEYNQALKIADESEYYRKAKEILSTI